MFEAFHFLRPYWLVALLPLAVLLWKLRDGQRQGGSWAKICDPQLLQHLLVNGTSSRNRYQTAILAVAWLLVVLALAGPTWEKLPQPVFRNASASVVLLDLSYSMDATDVKPSRLTRAKMKLLDLLHLQRDQQIALIGYAGDAYTISPLTDDADTIEALVPGLSTDIMPSPGSQLSSAIELGLDLFTQSGITSRGHMIVITDGVDDARTKQSIQALVSAGHRLSVLGIGTVQGAPIPSAAGGFLKDASGAIVMAPLRPAALQEIALLGSGAFALSTTDDSDLQRLMHAAFQTNDIGQSSDDQLTDRWREAGPWLLIPVLAILLLAFRRGWQLSLVLLFLLPTPNVSYAFEWDQLWQNNNQRALDKLEQGEAGQASELFDDPRWQGIANYRNNNYEEAAKLFSNQSNPTDLYNLGNALARAGKLQEALSAYEAALEQQPTHEDAQFNHDLVKQLLEQQQEEQSGDQQSEQNNQDQQSSEQDQSKDSNEPQDDQQDQAQQNDPQESQSESAEDSESNPADQSPAQQAENETEDEQSEQDEQSQQAAQQEQQAADEQPQEPPEQSIAQAEPSDAPSEEQQAMEQWLQRIPDDPGGLLRRKFLYEHQRRGQRVPSGVKTW